MASFRWILIGGSLLAHGALVMALGGIRTPTATAATAVEVIETTKKAEPPPPAEVKPVPEEPAPERARPKPAAAAAPPPEAPAAPAQPSLANLPDLGLELSGGGGGPGLAVPPPSPAAPRSTAPVTKTLERVVPKADTCDEPPAKPKLLDLPKPTYTEEARAASIEGKVRVEITVDENGKVIGAKVLSALGHGLDEAAIAAAKRATFEAAVRCGRPTRATFTIAIRFSSS